MQLNKIIYDIREILKLYTEDNEISDRYLIHLVNIKRSRFLRQELNNYQRTTDISVTQTLCLPVEQVSANQCGLDIQCDTILRTVKPIPQPLELHIKSAITSVKPSKKLAVPFSFVNKEKATYFEDSPFDGIFAYLDNDKYIYLVSKINTLNLIDCITITGVFEDPLDLLNYSNCCNCEDITPCYNIDTTNYPLQPHLIDLIKLEIVNELIKESQIREDKVNDSDNSDDKE
jgi:hypothetical protein